MVAPRAVPMTLHIFLIAVWIRSAEPQLVTVECLENCNIDAVKESINGEVGYDVKIKYDIHHSFDIISLQYDGKPLIVATRAIFLTFPSEHDFDFGDKQILTDSNNRFSLIITLKKLDIKAQDKKEMSFNLAYDGDQMTTTTHTTCVHDGPYMIGTWQTSYTMEDDTSKDVVVTVYSKPKPEVTAVVGDTPMEVSSVNIRQYTYDYTTKLHVDRTHCGKNMTLEAVGYKELSLTAKIDVLFNPWTPKDVYAYFSFKKCLTISWGKIESGNCPVTYTVQYNGTEVILNQTDSFSYSQCNFNASENDTVSVRAEVNGRMSPFSQPVHVIIARSPPEKGKQKAEWIKRWDFYLIISTAGVVFIGVIVWIIVMVTCRTKRAEDEECSIGSSNESVVINNSQYPEEEEISDDIELWPPNGDGSSERLNDKWIMLSLDLIEVPARNMQIESQLSPHYGKGFVDTIKSICK